jgi:hypothetical protein
VRREEGRKEGRKEERKEEKKTYSVGHTGSWREMSSRL